jgi:hypothetical protein
MHRSRRRGFTERFWFRLLLIKPMRCYRCLRRFYCPPSFIFEAKRRGADEPVPSGADRESPPDAPPEIVPAPEDQATPASHP